MRPLADMVSDGHLLNTALRVTDHLTGLLDAAGSLTHLLGLLEDLGTAAFASRRVRDHRGGRVDLRVGRRVDYVATRHRERVGAEMRSEHTVHVAHHLVHECEWVRSLMVIEW